MFYYVDCPTCKKDISYLATEEKLDTGPVYCPHCETKLRLKFSESFEEEMGCICGMFWFEPWED